MEKMSDKEKTMLRELQAKAKRIERDKKKLMAEADQIKDELLERWGVAPLEVPEVKSKGKWQELYAAYGIGADDAEGQEKLWTHLISERQINYYHTYVKK